MGQLEEIFLSAKIVDDMHIVLEVNVEEAKRYSPFYHIAMYVDGTFERKNLNGFASEFEQSNMTFVDNFPSLVWMIENLGDDDYPNHLFIDIAPTGTSHYFDIHVIDRMHQYEEPPERLTLELTDIRKS